MGKPQKSRRQQVEMELRYTGERLEARCWYRWHASKLGHQCERSWLYQQPRLGRLKCSLRGPLGIENILQELTTPPQKP
jgi:hypothetical protein